KKLWQECGVAPWLRERTPLLWYNDTLIAAVGVFVTKEGEADEAKLMIMQEKNNPADGVAELFRTVSDQ
ncbi:tRNA lysidine(34) synthetase TilS, partial [Morganella morganii]